jgi:hypothetical protein
MSHPVKSSHARMSLALLLLLLVCCGVTACSRKQTANDATKAVVGPRYVVMEKVLADTPGRPGTTMKVLIPKAVGREAVSAALTRALADARKQDPSLKAVILWAYRTRAELNGSNFTVGKLEWSADGKDFAGKTPLAPNPKMDIVAP